MAPDPQIWSATSGMPCGCSRLAGDKLTVPEVLARAPAPRRLLAAGFRLRRFHAAIDMRCHGRLRLGRTAIQQFRAAPARTSAGTEAWHCRAVVACLSLPRRAGTADRLSAGGAALVAPLAVRRRHRHHERAAATRLDHRRRTAATFLSPRSRRKLGHRGPMAVAAHRAPHAASERHGAEQRGRTRRHAFGLLAGHRRARLRSLGRLWRLLS